jgi:hypothetical protein
MRRHFFSISEMLCDGNETGTDHCYFWQCLPCIRTETDHLLFGNVDISVRTITVTDTDMWDFVYTSEILNMEC